MHRGNDKLKSIRVIMPVELYDALKARCGDYGDISKLVRRLLKLYLSKTVGQVGTAIEIDKLAACIGDEVGGDEKFTG